MVLPADAAPRRPAARDPPATARHHLQDNQRVYDMRTVLDVVFDDADWLEVQPRFGPAIICALAHLGGYPVAVSPTSRPSWPGPSTPTPPTRRRISSRSPTRSTCHRVPGRQPGHAAGRPIRTQWRTAQRRKDVRRQTAATTLKLH
jgi:hypothetical protein